MVSATGNMNLMERLSAILQEWAFTFVNYLLLALAIVISFVIGYGVGNIIKTIIQKILINDRIERVLVKYGAATSELWKSMVNFLALYINLLVAVLVVNVFVPLFIQSFLGSGAFLSTEYNIDIAAEIPASMKMLSSFMVSLLFLMISIMGGIILGGIAYKITKDSLIGLGLDRELWKHHMAESVAGTSVSTIFALIVKWFIVLLFLTTGIQMFIPSVQVGEQELVLTKFMEGLLDYIPNATLGFLIVLAAIIISDFAATYVKTKKTPFGDLLPLIVELIIIFFGAVLALPKFGFEDVSVLSYSFIILMAGLSLGIAIAIGLGLKDRIAKGV